MPRRDGAEGACIVIESSRIVVDACCFHHLVEVSSLAVQVAVETPWRSDFKYRIVTGMYSMRVT